MKELIMALIKPLKNMVVGQVPATNEVKTSSGLIMNNVGSNMIHMEAKVVAIGPDVKDVSVGDRIIYDVSQATILDINSTEYKLSIVDDKYVFAVISPEAKDKYTFENRNGQAVEAIAKTLVKGLHN
jgi:co-chaperonin GroES (HSP10)